MRGFDLTESLLDSFLALVGEEKAYLAPHVFAEQVRVVGRLVLGLLTHGHLYNFVLAKEESAVLAPLVSNHFEGA